MSEKKTVSVLNFFKRNLYYLSHKYLLPTLTIIYQEILEKEVQKLGLTISDVIQKEHFFIANTKITIGNCITSIKTVNRINFSELLVPLFYTSM